MPIVAEVLAAIKQHSGIEGSSVSGDGVCVEVADLAKRAGEAKVAVLQALEGQYVQLCSALQNNTVLQTRVSHNLEQLERLQGTLDGEVKASVAQSADAVSGVAIRWQQAVQGLQVAQQLLTIHDGLKAATDASNAGKFLSAAKSLHQVEQLSIVDNDLEVQSGILEEVMVQRTTLIYLLSQVWTQALRWEEELLDQDKQKILTLLIRCWHADGPEKEDSCSNASGDEGVSSASSRVGELCRDLRQALAALDYLGELQPRLNTLADKLIDNFFRVVLTRKAKVALRECGDAFSLSVTFSTAPQQSDSSRHLPDRPPPEDVFANLEKLLKCLHKTGFGLEFESCKDPERSTTTLMKMLGQQVGKKFTELLISECLASAVPCSRKNLHEFDAVKASTHAFHAMLVDIGFYSGSEASILDYAANVDSVFSNKACAHLLDTARELITRPLHHTVTISPQDTYPPLALQDENGARLEKSTLRLEKLLAAKTFHMPKCQVSASICELVDLVHDTLEEACSSSPLLAGRLVCTVRNMLALYDHITPVAHAHTLDTIPQHAALVHNNSMFISTHCYLLAHQYRNRLPPELREGGPCVTSFTDLSYQITKSGTEVFLKAMTGHKRALLDTIGQAQGVGEVPSGTGVRQCLHQLQQLRNVWVDVLPHSVYNKSMATLLNSVVRELIERTLCLEDIAEDAAVTLVSSLAVLKDNAGSLFPDCSIVSTSPSTASGAVPPEGLSGVRQWGRFLELMVVLGASLRELQDRWADGKGPLALYFTPDQAKALVRALFQNTDRRAQLLARIKLQ